jgi:flavin-binding protein dodecin
MLYSERKYLSKGVFAMSDNSIYKIIELVGSSPTSWEDAAKSAVEKASKTLDDIRIAEVTKLDIRVEDGKMTYRARLTVSFKLRDSAD